MSSDSFLFVVISLYSVSFQNRFDGMWRKLQTYQSGEELFGLPVTDYPELSQIRKELNLLQKLYKLYNDVIDRVSSYYDIPWNDVNIEEINNELMEFQNRCRKLPKGLKVRNMQEYRCMQWITWVSEEISTILR